MLPPRDGESPNSRFFKQDPISGELSIYWEEWRDGSWHEEPATLDECAELERAAVWDPVHVEGRLRDHFAGTPNTWAASLAIDASLIPD
jgi:hypothetical protein